MPIHVQCNVGLLFAGFGVSQFLFYTVMPQVMRFSSALIVNLSLLTADFYTLFFGIFVFHYKVRLWLVNARVYLALSLSHSLSLSLSHTHTHTVFYPLLSVVCSDNPWTVHL